MTDYKAILGSMNKPKIPVGNLLQLFDEICKQGRASLFDDSEKMIEDTLRDLAHNMGFSDRDIRDALASDRCLTIYEP